MSEGVGFWESQGGQRGSGGWLKEWESKGAGGKWEGGANTGSDQSATHAFLKLKSKVPFQEKTLRL